MTSMRRWTVLFVITLMLLTAAGAFGCPMCKDSVPNSDAQAVGGVPSGFNITIYMMLLAVFAVAGMVILTLVKGARSGGHVTAPRSSQGS
jgi:heme/copper-type cytochrome/quinol oxidase subunit 2